jgi:hemerythrin
MSLLEWKTVYSVGVKELDQQHRTLLDLINDLSAENTDHGLRRSLIVLNDLIKYAELHFITEEDLMRLHGFSGLNMQQSEHEAFVKKVFDLDRQLEGGNLEVFSETVYFLKDWFITHVLGTDMEYKAFFKSKNVT